MKPLRPIPNRSIMTGVKLRSRVPQLMRERGIFSPTRLKALTGLGYATCHRLSRGQPPSRAATIAALSRALGVEPGDLFSFR